MPSSTWSDRLACSYGVLRGAVLVLLSAVLIIAPEKALPGSSSEPARALGLMFASRTILLGLSLAVLGIRGKRAGLAWVLLADAAFQLFDTGMAVVSGKGALAILPAAIGAVDVWAALALLRAAKASPQQPVR